MGLLACCALLTTACGNAGLGVGPGDPEPICAKEHCDLDAAYIGGNIDVPSSAAVRLEVETCVDGVCDEPVTLMLDGGQYAFRRPILLMGNGTCPGQPFMCGDTAKWWIGWTSPIESADGGLATSYRIVIRNLATHQTLEDHTFDDPTYETVAARGCKPGTSSDGEVERVTCTHFIGTWD